nr:retrovirus-related Pol polyprotein from transposon TNT 1-94 [Tanacetum cinerariifolium]
MIIHVLLVRKANITEPLAEAVNTACYIQNRVLVTKPHNRTPYELLHGRLLSIGFMRPFRCPVTILNTLDPLGKFQGKVDEGFLVGYSVSSSSPAWLFDIDSLTQTMNYHPVPVENQTNSHAGFQDTKKKYVSPDIHSSSSGAQTRKQGDKTENKDKGKNHVVTITGFKDLNAEFEECNNNSSNGVNAASSSVSAAGHNCINSTNNFSAAGPSNAAMPNMEDLSHDADDVGAEADINNMESIISVSPIPTTRIHKDHPASQIIGDLSSTTQTRSMARAVRDQGSGLAWLFDIDSLTRIMNYHPAIAENQTNSHAGLQDTEKAGEERTHIYVLFPVLSDDDIQKSVSPDIHSSSSGAQIRKQGDKTENKDKECTNNSSNGVNAASSSVSTAGHNFINSTTDFSVAGPLNVTASLTAANSSDMPNLEDLIHSDDADDVGAEANINNLESIISVSPIPTTRIHKDHLTSQIIGDLSSTTQTRNMARAVRDQGGISQMFNEDFHTCMFACFLSQDEPKRVHQALKDPS